MTCGCCAPRLFAFGAARYQRRRGLLGPTAWLAGLDDGVGVGLGGRQATSASSQKVKNTDPLRDFWRYFPLPPKDREEVKATGIAQSACMSVSLKLPGADLI